MKNILKYLEKYESRKVDDENIRLTNNAISDENY